MPLGDADLRALRAAWEQWHRGLGDTIGWETGMAYLRNANGPIEALAAQLAETLVLAASRRVSVSWEHVSPDRGSGCSANPGSRPSLAGSAQEFRCVVVHGLDRLGRDPTTAREVVRSSDVKSVDESHRVEADDPLARDDP